jgi:CheY-like chemotaxis protein
MNLRGVRVLVVEDDTSTRELLDAILTFCGAEVVAVASVAQAMEALAGHPPAVIVSDISMPVEDGYALLARLQARGLRIPTVAITAHRYHHTPERSRAAGFWRHLTKPVDPQTLCDTVADVAFSAGKG